MRPLIVLAVVFTVISALALASALVADGSANALVLPYEWSFVTQPRWLQHLPLIRKQ